MAAVVTNLGLQLVGDRASAVAGFPGAIQAMSVDDSATSLNAATTNLGSPTNFIAQSFDTTPTRSGQTVTHIATLAAGTFNGNTIKRVCLHDVVGGSVTATSTTLVGGIDSLSLLKGSTFSLAITVRLSYT